MYPVSDEFLKAIDSNTRSYYWTGSIVTKNHVTYEFDNTNIVKGSGYITRQCCGSSEIELGTVYASELGITLLNDIDRYTLDGAEVKIFFHLNLPDGSVETVPMGIFEVTEASRNIRCLELKGYPGTQRQSLVSGNHPRHYRKREIHWRLHLPKDLHRRQL